MNILVECVPNIKLCKHQLGVYLCVIVSLLKIDYSISVFDSCIESMHHAILLRCLVVYLASQKSCMLERGVTDSVFISL